MQCDYIQTMIEQGLPDSQVSVTGDGRHFEAVVINDAFAGKGLLEQHRMVYATLGDKMGGEIHALSMRTYTRAQWEKTGK
ncbi:MAG: BolA/IbaG family iron-sulfur metabolism protein [Pseudomonadota bacterium]